MFLAECIVGHTHHILTSIDKACKALEEYSNNVIPGDIAEAVLSAHAAILKMIGAKTEDTINAIAKDFWDSEDGQTLKQYN